MTVEEIIELLQLQPHPEEGGFFCETYRAQQVIPLDSLPGGYTGPRNVGTAIYYFLTPNTFSEMHQLVGDEVFHFYMGDPVEMLQLHPDGSHQQIVLGTDLKAGQRPQAVVKAGVWQGSRLVEGGQYALLGATMAPGFDYADYVGGTKAELTEHFPDQADLIDLLTKK